MLRRRKSKKNDAANPIADRPHEEMVRIIRPGEPERADDVDDLDLAPTQPAERPTAARGAFNVGGAIDTVAPPETRVAEHVDGVGVRNDPRGGSDGNVANSWDASSGSGSVTLGDTGAFDAADAVGPSAIDPMLRSSESDDVAPPSHDQAHVGGSGIRVVPAGAGLSTPEWLQTGPDDDSGDTEARRTVVISDDGSSSVAPATGGSARGMDPRIRARRRAVRRAFGRKRLVWLSAAAVVFVVALVGGALLGSGLFAVHKDQIVVTGWVYSDPTSMNAVLDELAGTPVLRVDEKAFAKRFEAVPRVQDARVITRLPNAATVEIRERSPLTTYMGADGRFRIMDREGRVIDIIDGMPIEFVWITCDTPPALELGEFAPAGLAAASEMTRNFTPTVRPRVRRIAVDPSGAALALYFRDGTRVNFGSAKDLFSKLVRLETLLTDYPDMTNAQIDVSTADTTRASADLLKIAEAQAKADEAEADQAETSNTQPADSVPADEVAADSGATDGADGTAAPTTPSTSAP